MELSTKKRAEALWALSISLCFFLTLNTFILISPPIAFFPHANEQQFIQNYFEQSCLFSFIVAFFVYAIGAFFIPRVFQRRTVIPAVLLLYVGFIILFTLSVTSTLPDMLFFLSSVCIGAGYGCGLICWEQLVAELAKEEVHSIFLIGSSSSVAAYLILQFIPQSIVLLVVLVLILPACFIPLVFMIKRSKEVAFFDAKPFENKTRYLDLLKELWVPIVCIIPIGILSPIIGTVALGENLLPTSPIIFAQTGNIAAVLILYVFWKRLGRSPGITKAYMVVLPVLAIMLLIFPFISTSGSYILLFLGALCFCFFSIIIMVTCISTARAHRVSLVITYCIFATVLYLSRFVGSLLGEALSQSVYSHETQIIAAVFFLVYLASLGAFIAFKTTKEPGDNNKQAAAAVVEKVDTTQERCDKIAKEYSLSQREREILELLARGRSVPNIARELYLSENTIRTHTKNLYLALNVHTKQELITLVESTDKPTE